MSVHVRHVRHPYQRHDDDLQHLSHQQKQLPEHLAVLVQINPELLMLQRRQTSQQNLNLRLNKKAHLLLQLPLWLAKFYQFLEDRTTAHLWGFLPPTLDTFQEQLKNL